MFGAELAGKGEGPAGSPRHLAAAPGLSAAQAEGIAEVLADPEASALATKLDLQVLKTDFEKALHRQTWGLIGVMFAQGAFIVAVPQLLSSPVPQRSRQYPVEFASLYAPIA
jgi:hypothetical protein